MKKSGKLGAAALLLCGTLALSAMGMGFAKWQTTLHAEGDVAASGKWDVVLTDASVTLSNGAEIRGNDADYSLQNVIAANKKGQACIEAAVSRTKVTSYPTTGTQNSRFAVSSWLWLVDTTRFDLSKLGTLDTEQRRLTMLDGLLIGIVQSGANTYINSSMSDTFVYLILIVVLMIRPAGILGKNVGEKV